MSIFESFYQTKVEPSRPSAMPDLPMKPPDKPKPLRKKRARKPRPEPGFFSRLCKLVSGKAKVKKRTPRQDGLVQRKRKRSKSAGTK